MLEKINQRIYGRKYGIIFKNDMKLEYFIFTKYIF